MKAFFMTMAFALSAQADLAEQNRYYQSRYGNPPSATTLLSVAGAGKIVDGTRRTRAAIPGVLYWGGGPGGMKPMSRQQVGNLCREGFSSAYYLYKTKGYTDNIRCDGNSTSYTYNTGDYRSERVVRAVFDLIQDVIDSRGSRGPVYVHCWNGKHASNYIASLALIQFCGWSNTAASKHFNALFTGNAGRKAHTKRILNFKPYSGYRVDPQIRDQICRH